MLRLAFDFIITWRETRTRPNAYGRNYKLILMKKNMFPVVSVCSFRGAIR